MNAYGSKYFQRQTRVIVIISPRASPSTQCSSFLFFFLLYFFSFLLFFFFYLFILSLHIKYCGQNHFILKVEIESYILFHRLDAASSKKKKKLNQIQFFFKNNNYNSLLFCYLFESFLLLNIYIHSGGTLFHIIIVICYFKK